MKWFQMQFQQPKWLANALRLPRIAARLASSFVLLLFIFLLTTFATHPDAKGVSEFSNTEARVKAVLAQAGAQAAGQYGASAVVGQALEPCDTQTTIPGARVLASTDDWQTALQNATPGTTLLLHGGVYAATQKLTVKAGQAGQLVTVKPYNCEVVTLRGSFTPLSYTVMAGLRIEGTGLPVASLNYVIRLDGKNKGALRNLVIRNNTIVGGAVDALRINDDVVGVILSGNNIDGGKGGHDIFVTTEVTPVNPAVSPDNLTVTNNLLTKVYFRTLGSASEDMFQVRDARRITFAHNTCTNGSRMEQCIDIKAMTVPIVIQANFFDGTNLHLDGPGEDDSAGCMVIHEMDGHPENHLIETNYFKNCRDTVIRFASEGGAASSSGTVRYNVFVNPDSSDLDGLLIWRAQDVVFQNNTMIRGTLKLGRSNGLTLNPPITPKNTVLKNNIFYQTRIDDNTRAPDFVYTCSYNTLFGVIQQGNQALNCTQSLTNDPLLTAIAAEDYKPAPSSPACGSGENGVDRGAIPCATGASTPTPTNRPPPAATATKTPTPTNTPPPAATPTKTPTPSASSKGSINGKVTNDQNTPIKSVNVTIYRQNGSSWKSVTSAKTNSTGDYLVSELAVGVYRMRFSKSNYATQYYDKTTTVNAATNVQVNAGMLTSGINAILLANNSATIRAASASNFSGHIIDAKTGAPIENATVTLYQVPNWRPRTDANDNAPDTCESPQSKAPDVAWSQPAPIDLGEWLSAEVDEVAAAAQIAPTENPQLTSSDGHYAWAVHDGCWYVVVEADGYTTTTSTVLGAAATATNFPLALAPLQVIYLPLVTK